MLELKNITRVVDTGRKILDDLSVKIPEGGLTVITGHNGSGKTSLAKIIAGTDDPTNGKIIFNGEDITDLDVTERAKKGIAFAFQQPVRFKGISVRGILSLAAGNDNEDELSAALVKVGLQPEKYLDRDVDAHLSGGEMKRIEIASVLLRKARLSIFDEPEAGIDIWSFKELVSTFESLKKETKGTIIIISHQERILSAADNIIVMESGHIADIGTRDEIYPKLFCDTGCPFREKVTL